MMRPLCLLLLSLLLSSVVSTTSVTFKCSTAATCQAMIGYISPKATVSAIKNLFGIESPYSLLAANSWSLSGSDPTFPAGSTVRIPFPCRCINGTGKSDGTPVYIVKKDDTLGDIARNFCREFVTYQEIAAANNIPDPDKIKENQKLWIPLPCNCDEVKGARVVHYGHVVAAGSSVDQIAREFGTTADTVLSLNEDNLLNADDLRARQVLDVPLKACNAPMSSGSLETSPLLVPNGSNELTANNCIQCSCNLEDMQLQCTQTQGLNISQWSQCPSAQYCSGNLSLGQSINETCMRTTCSYAGYTNSSILTALTNQSTCSRPDKRKKLHLLLVSIGVPILGASVLMATTTLVFFLYRRRFNKRAQNNKDVEMFLKSNGSLAPKRYKYSELKKMTNSFKEKIGHGGYGSVFKGKLPNGCLVAVKVLTESKGNGQEFINEVASIGKTYHVNVVSLLGFCFQGSKRALIYEYMANGSLEKYIYGNTPRDMHPLGWEKLYKIALDIARGLEYLHLRCSMRILHLDIKPHNILLDEDFFPKISDFGLAKLCSTKDSVISKLTPRGTFGYTAPEVHCRNFGGVSYKSDVYSYGMMVLEMVGGRKNIDVEQNTSQIYFPQWIYTRLNQLGNDIRVNIEGLPTGAEGEMARKMSLVGLWCIQMSPADRPSMSRVMEMFQGSMEDIQMPPNPFPSPPS